MWKQKATHYGNHLQRLFYIFFSAHELHYLIYILSVSFLFCLWYGIDRLMFVLFLYGVFVDSFPLMEANMAGTVALYILGYHRMKKPRQNGKI